MKIPVIQVIPITKCNWNCSYCDIPKIDQKICTYDEFKRGLHLASLAHSDSINICGGEPGLLPREHLQYLIDKYYNKKHLSIVTNGQFLKRYPEYTEYFKNILWHLFPEVQYEFKFEFDISDNVWPTIVAHNMNIRSVIEFVKKYNYINFMVIPYSPKEIHEFDTFVFRKPDDLIELSSLPNLHTDTKYKIKNIISFYFKDKKEYKRITKFCSSIALYPVLDLIKNKILKCCTSYTEIDGIELNEKNIRRLHTMKFNCCDDICDGCFLPINERYFPYFVRRFLNEKQS